MSVHRLALLLAYCLLPAAVQAQTEEKEEVTTVPTMNADSLEMQRVDSLVASMQEEAEERASSLTELSEKDSIAINKELEKLKRKKQFIPDPQRALWLGLVFPGGGQIYNRKFWKLPIFYGGLVGCAYAYSWNNQMYRDYAQAYLDLMDDDPNTKSYEQMLPLKYSITGQESRFQETFRRKKDYYRKYRDLSLFCMIGVYLLSVVDAYVDAHLSVFDISEDLSLHIEPAVIQRSSRVTSLGDCAYGLQCSLNF